MAPSHENQANNAGRTTGKPTVCCLASRGFSRKHEIKTAGRLLLILATSVLLFSLFWINSGAAQQADEPTSTPNISGAYITVTYGDPINVRAGPSSFDYPIIGRLPVGGTAPAIGRSPAGEWIQISFPTGSRGVGWVYAPNVELSPGALLPVVEPPPTPTPLETTTINPTFAAALQPNPTATRKPTFTAPGPLNLPTYVNPETKPVGSFQTGWLIIGLGAIGLLGMAISSLRRH